MKMVGSTLVHEEMKSWTLRAHFPFLTQMQLLQNFLHKELHCLQIGKVMLSYAAFLKTKYIFTFFYRVAFNLCKRKIYQVVISLL